MVVVNSAVSFLLYLISVAVGGFGPYFELRAEPTVEVCLTQILTKCVVLLSFTANEGLGLGKDTPLMTIFQPVRWKNYVVFAKILNWYK